MSRFSILYTRRQLQKLTGIDDAVLDYWARSGVLRAAEGGGGKGQHRQFEAAEVTLAAILAELLRFGVSAASLASLANSFHRSIDWIWDQGAQDHVDLLGSLFAYREDIEMNGSAAIRDDGAVDALGSDIPRIAALRSEEMGPWKRLLTWKQIVAYHELSYPGLGLPDALVQFVEDTGKHDWDEHSRRFKVLDPSRRSPRVAHQIVFDRAPNGEWREYIDDEEIGHLVGYFKIDLGVLKRRLWGTLGGAT